MGLTFQKLQLVGRVDTDTEEVYRRFRSLLEVSPLTHQELADELEVSRPAVSQWASGDTRPKLETMIAAIGVIQDRLGEIQDRANAALDAVVAAEEAIEARERYEEETTDENRDKMFAAIDRLEEIVGTRETRPRGGESED